jgi:hypothetical protein
MDQTMRNRRSSKVVCVMAQHKICSWILGSFMQYRAIRKFNVTFDDTDCVIVNVTDPVAKNNTKIWDYPLIFNPGVVISPKSGSTIKKRYTIWYFILLPVAILLVTQPFWQPYFDNCRCNRIASELEEQYDLIVRYGDPSQFYVPPKEPLVDVPEKGFFIKPTQAHFAHTALKGVKEALSKYPASLIKKYLKAVFISGVIKSYDIQIAGSYLNSWIYLSALEKYEKAGVELYPMGFHHELSSLFLKGNNFPTIRWQLANEPDFKYLPSQKDVVRAASPENHRDPKEASSWYRAGFVHLYGMSSMENDFNMYAELAMTDPEKLKKLADQYPRIQAKTRILVDYYSSLAPELGEYMASVGLTKTPGSTQAHQEQQ